MRVTFLTTLALLVSACLVVAVGCQGKVRSSLSTKIGEREVNLTVDGYAFMSPEDATTVIMSIGNHKLALEKERILWDGKELGKVPGDAKAVQLDYSNGTLSVTADGKQVLSANPPK